MQKITTFLWFDTQAEEAANYYIGIFKDGKKLKVSHYGEGAPLPKGSVMSVSFELFGQKFIALNGGPQFSFTPAISLMVACDGQNEVDKYWDTMVADGQPGPCGWLTDKYGLSWQIVPKGLQEMISDEDTVKADRALQALYKMQKVDLKAIEDAYNGK